MAGMTIDTRVRVSLRVSPHPARKLAEAFATFAAKLRKAYGPRATPRRRPRRVAKKIAARGGYMRHDCVGAYTAKMGSAA